VSFFFPKTLFGKEFDLRVFQSRKISHIVPFWQLFLQKAPTFSKFLLHEVLIINSSCGMSSPGLQVIFRGNKKDFKLILLLFFYTPELIVTTIVSKVTSKAHAKCRWRTEERERREGQKKPISGTDIAKEILFLSFSFQVSFSLGLVLQNLSCFRPPFWRVLFKKRLLPKIFLSKEFWKRPIFWNFRRRTCGFTSQFQMLLRCHSTKFLLPVSMVTNFVRPRYTFFSPQFSWSSGGVERKEEKALAHD